MNRVWESGSPAASEGSLGPQPLPPPPPTRAPVPSHRDVDKRLGPESKGLSLDKSSVTDLLGVFSVTAELCMRPAFFAIPS